MRRPAKRGPGFYGDIVAYDKPTHTAVVQLQDTSLGCAKVYYRCGDIRLGGDPNPPEYWLGQICKMWDLGGGKFRIQLAGGKRTPAVGDQNVYLWWQDCTMDLCP